MSETIPFLARCLEKIVVRAPTADELRAAANDDQSYNDKLWALLHRFVILDMAIKKVNECPSIDKLHELSQITPQTLSDDEMHYVKWYMDGIHFKLPMFYSEETTNSRILILSIGWMLEYTRFFDIYYILRDRESATKLPLAFTPPYPPDTSFDESNIMASSSRTESQQTSAFVSVFDSNKSKLENHEQISNKLRQIVYLNGKIDISLRAMDQLQEEYHAKMNKILQHSTDRDPVHNPKLRHSLGFERVAAIKSSLRERALKALDMHTTLVQDRTKEHQLENNVWRWLNHVFECADKAGQCGVPPNKPQKSRVHFEDRHIEQGIASLDSKMGLLQECVTNFSSSARNIKDAWSEIKSNLTESQYSECLMKMRDVAKEVDTIIPLDDQTGISLTRDDLMAHAIQTFERDLLTEETLWKKYPSFAPYRFYAALTAKPVSETDEEAHTQYLKRVLEDHLETIAPIDEMSEELVQRLIQEQQAAAQFHVVGDF